MHITIIVIIQIRSSLFDFSGIAWCNSRTMRLPKNVLRFWFSVAHVIPSACIVCHALVHWRLRASVRLGCTRTQGRYVWFGCYGRGDAYY